MVCTIRGDNMEIKIDTKRARRDVNKLTQDVRVFEEVFKDSYLKKILNTQVNELGKLRKKHKKAGRYIAELIFEMEVLQKTVDILYEENNKLRQETRTGYAERLDECNCDSCRDSQYRR